MACFLYSIATKKTKSKLMALRLLSPVVGEELLHFTLFCSFIWVVSLKVNQNWAKKIWHCNYSVLLTILIEKMQNKNGKTYSFDLGTAFVIACLVPILDFI